MSRVVVETGCSASRPRAAADCIEIGLFNNMPDAALEATERQFIALIEAAASDTTIRLRLFALPGVPRSARAQRHLSQFYCRPDQLEGGGIDALIVTGTEPRAPALADEPYWPALATLIDWAERNTISTIWSCLAAHAAVHHLDRVPRHRLAEKCFGVLDCVKAADHPLTDGMARSLAVPHSRWNELREDDLVSRGYDVLTRLPQGGVDMFARQRDSLFVFFQGHPEYEAATLLGEYRRDVARFLRRQIETCPSPPRGCFDEATAEALTRWHTRAIAERREAVLADFPVAAAQRGLRNGWRPAALRIYRNWLAVVASRKERRAPAADFADLRPRRSTAPRAAFAIASGPAAPPALGNGWRAHAPFVERRRHSDPSGPFTGAHDRRVPARS